MKKLSILTLLVLFSIILIWCGKKSPTQQQQQANPQATVPTVKEQIAERNNQAANEQENSDQEDWNDAWDVQDLKANEWSENNNDDQDSAENSDDNDSVWVDGTYVVNTNSSSVLWKADKVIWWWHQWSVKIKSWEANFKDGVLDSGKFVIDMESIVSNVWTNLNDHLKSSDFFDSELFPEASLTINSTKVIPWDDWDITETTWDLTIKWITNSVTFPVEHSENRSSAKLTIDRTLWNITYWSENFFDDLADKAIKDTFELEVNLTYEKE